jgi:hypothetical protein
MEDRIRENAEIVRRVALETLHVDVAYDLDGVRWLDGYIDRQRSGAAEDVKVSLRSTLGSYLGECIRRTYGGRWTQDPEYGWCIWINDSFSVFPFNKVEKQLANSEGDSVLGLFTSIGPLLSEAKRSAQSRGRSSSMKDRPPKRPWWKFW